MENIVAQRIKAVLEDRQISIAAFAKRIGMQQVTCNRQIRGDQAVSLSLIEGFLQEYSDISAEWLLRGNGTKQIQAGVDYKSETTHCDKDDSIWKAKYEAIKECYDILVTSLGGSVIGKRNVG
jgi:transcriptional regulator with XRE-family HTH domain